MLCDTFVKLNMSHMSGNDFNTLPQEHIYCIFIIFLLFMCLAFFFLCVWVGRYCDDLIMRFTMLPLNFITLPYLIAERLYKLRI